ncbi:hypothetical protein ACOMHN_029638 [Nucella lapillus]
MSQHGMQLKADDGQHNAGEGGRGGLGHLLQGSHRATVTVGGGFWSAASWDEDDAWMKGDGGGVEGNSGYGAGFFPLQVAQASRSLLPHRDTTSVIVYSDGAW